ncbi:hypothetical protein QYS49_12945 [Marivirga salinae]|uniref:Uncharacterized protein n=1 Tax=Marivirga salinarum TaxID=3059078 RepID=A0AA49J9R5_9BACT|nr:hypothetical protein [Marivirga sp. BDSF4-3]WKK77896.1 hypothetical protein QYS49_12945 [Marivirga sp. BDSF4-3]
MKNIFFAYACVSFCMLSCISNPPEEKEPYQRWVGDISFDEKTDDPDFQLCYEEKYIRQYFNFSKGVQYKGEKPAIIRHFKENYKPVQSDQSGLLRIRFIVNCKGETDRFRLMGMNDEYQPMKFDSEISNQLLALTKKMEGWLPVEMDQMDNMTLDYYQYLIFKIHNGEIIEIMP